MPVFSEITTSRHHKVSSMLLMYIPLHIRSFSTQLYILDICQRTLPFLWSLTWFLVFLSPLSLPSFIGNSLCNFPYSCLLPYFFKNMFYSSFQILALKFLFVFICRTNLFANFRRLPLLSIYLCKLDEIEDKLTCCA